MREILFRGKSNYGNIGEWEYGLVAQPHVTEDGIVTSYYFTKLCEDGHSSQRTVSANTIGQYTGLTDRNGTKIYEGDILEFADLAEDGYEYREAYDFVNRAVVGFIDGQFTLTEFAEDDTGVTDMVRGAEYYSRDELLGVIKESEVIGNIHDNPELLKGGEG